MTAPKLKSALKIVGVLLLVWIVAWALGEHGHTYTMEPAKKIFVADSNGTIATEWTCADEDQGPFQDWGKDKDPDCREPVRKCPVLWFPVASQSPCPYKDPLGGPYTQDDLFVLRQSQRSSYFFPWMNTPKALGHSIGLLFWILLFTLFISSLKWLYLRLRYPGIRPKWLWWPFSRS